MDYLIEAKRIVKELAIQVKEADRLQIDEMFLWCLSKEIEESISEMENPKAVFVINELGEVLFENIVEEEVEGNNYIHISLNKNNFDGALVEEINEQGKIVDSILEEEQFLQELDKKIEDVNGIYESLVSLRNKKQIRLSEKQKNSNRSMEITKERLEVDLAIKKRKLIDKLLESK